MKLFWKSISIVAFVALGALRLPGQYPPPPSQRAEIPFGGLNFSSPDQFNGSVEQAPAYPGAIKLSLQDAIDRALKANLGMLVRESAGSAARAQRLNNLSALLPNVSAGISEYETQISLAVYGLSFPGIPKVVGPFSYTDARAFANVPAFDWTAFKNLKAATENARAAQLSIDDGRDLVVQAVATGYVTILADAARIEVTNMQIETAQALADTTHDRHEAGVAPAIDDIRAQVELKSEQQRLLILKNQLAKDKLTLARAIGLPAMQDFETTDQAPFKPLDNLKADNLLSQAFEARSDYRSAEAQLKAAEIARQAASAQRLPTGYVTANYGVIGPNLGQSHGTFTVAGTLSVNVFDSGRIRSDENSADAEIERRRNELADLKGKIEFEVRSALIDLSSAADQVNLARSNLDLAMVGLEQARDRVTGGVTDNLEVIQTQEAVAAANQDLINGLFLHNLAKVALARAVGSTDTSLKRFLGGD